MKAFLIAGLLVSTTAIAGKPPAPNVAAAGAIAGAASQSAAYAHQGQLQGQLQGQSLSNKNANSAKQANKQSTSYTEAKQDYNDMYEDYVSAAYAPSVQPTVPCLVPINGGVVVPAVGSISAGSGAIDRGCEMRETIRIGLSSNDPSTQSIANAVLQNMLVDMLNEQTEIETPVVESTSPISQVYESDFIGG